MLTTSAAQLGAPAERLDVTFAAKANVGERLPMLAVTLAARRRDLRRSLAGGERQCAPH